MKSSALILGVLLIGAPHAHANVDFLFSSDNTTSMAWIERINGATGLRSTLYQVGYFNGRPQSLLEKESQLYWTTYQPGRLMRSNIAGQGVTQLLDQGNTTARELRWFNGTIYFANDSTRKIYRVNQDGSDLQIALDTSGFSNASPWDFEIVGDRFYWTSFGGGAIASCRLDGTDYLTLRLPGSARPFSLESNGQSLFVTDIRLDNNPHLLYQVNLGLTTAVLLFQSATIDLGNLSAFDGRLYFSSSAGPNTDVVTTIHSISEDGMGLRTEWTGSTRGYPRQIRAVPNPSGTIMVCVLACIAQPRRRRD